MLQPMLGFWFGRTGLPASTASSAARRSLPVTGKDLRAALDAVLAAKPLPADQKPSIGCNIKWQPGNEPDYFK
jgi:hypothetical protein